MDVERLREMWEDESLSRADIAKRLGVSKGYCQYFASRIGLPSQRGSSLPTHGVTREEFTREWMDFSQTRDEIAFRLRIPRSTCADLAQSFGLPMERGSPMKLPGEYLPTQEEIREKCLYIQSRWTDEEWQERERRRSPELRSFTFDGAACSFSEAGIV